MDGGRLQRPAGRSAVRQKVFFDIVAVGLEQHVGAAELADLLFRALDHAVALARLLVEDLAASRHLETLLGAGFGLDLGHLALLGRWTSGHRPGPAGMLVMSWCAWSTSPQPRQPLSAGRRKAGVMTEAPANGKCISSALRAVAAQRRSRPGENWGG